MHISSVVVFTGMPCCVSCVEVAVGENGAEQTVVKLAENQPVSYADAVNASFLFLPVHL